MEKANSLCICRGCPTYAGTGETSLSFCFAGKSKKIKKEQGCVCARCPVTKQADLRHGYYCTRGSEKDQSGEPSEKPSGKPSRKKK